MEALFLWKGDAMFSSLCDGGKNQNCQTSNLSSYWLLWPSFRALGLMAKFSAAVSAVSEDRSCSVRSKYFYWMLTLCPVLAETDWWLVDSLTSHRSQSTSDLVMAEEGHQLARLDLTEWISGLSTSLIIPLICPVWNLSTSVNFSD